MGLRRDVKDGTLTRVEVKALVDDPNLSDRFRLWAHRWLKRNQTNPPRGTSPGGNRPELDVNPAPRGGKRKRKRNKSKVFRPINR
jgi:hypothetical protein